jgi:hypothetical protein
VTLYDGSSTKQQLDNEFRDYTLQVKRSTSCMKMTNMQQHINRHASLRDSLVAEANELLKDANRPGFQVPDAKHV